MERICDKNYWVGEKILICILGFRIFFFWIYIQLSMAHCLFIFADIFVNIRTIEENDFLCEESIEFVPKTPKNNTNFSRFFPII